MNTKNQPVTRDIDPGSAQDLLERVPRACLAFAGDNGPLLQPVEVVWQAGRYWIGIPAETNHPPATGQEVVLLIDEGIYYFDLRALTLRGQAQPAAAPPGARAGCAWLELIPTKMVAWDYGKMRPASKANNA